MQYKFCDVSDYILFIPVFSGLIQIYRLHYINATLTYSARSLPLIMRSRQDMEVVLD